MPLHASEEKPAYDAKCQLTAVWMYAGDESRGDSRNRVRVFVSLEALWNLEPTYARTPNTARAIFDLHRARLEIKAGARHTSYGPEEGEFYRGRPIVVLTTVDLMRW